VGALVRREDERAEALRRLGAQVVEGDLTDLASMHRAIEGCRRVRPIRYRDVPLPAWSESLRQAGVSEHLVRHLSAMAELTRQGRYDRMTDTMCNLTGKAPTNMRNFVKLHAAEFKQLDRCIPEAISTSRDKPARASDATSKSHRQEFPFGNAAFEVAQHPRRQILSTLRSLL
jgi:hypothetical protein